MGHTVNAQCPNAQQPLAEIDGCKPCNCTIRHRRAGKDDILSVSRFVNIYISRVWWVDVVVGVYVKA